MTRERRVQVWRTEPTEGPMFLYRKCGVTLLTALSFFGELLGRD
jgi:hypothetical protein